MQRPSTASQIPDLTGYVTLIDRFAAAHGGFADVYEGLYYGESTPSRVAVKVLRSQTDDEDDRQKRNKRLRRELKVWQRLNHENILPLYGTTSDFGPYSSMVCPWISNGNLNKYLDRRGDTLVLSDRFRILCEVASGLLYLHSCAVIHGDLSGSNILIGDNGRACVSDFGMSEILSEFQGTSYFTSSIGGAVRWAAPELYRIYEDHSFPVVTVECDVYSFGSVVLQILTGQVPYYYIKSDLQVVFELHKGLCPRRPTEPWVTEAHWTFIKRCWAKHEDRPSMAEAFDHVQRYRSDCTETIFPSPAAGRNFSYGHNDRNTLSMMTTRTENSHHIPPPLSASPSSLPFSLAHFPHKATDPQMKTTCARPSTAPRPGTAPAFYTPARSSHYVVPEVISRTKQSRHGGAEGMPIELTRLGALDVGQEICMEFSEESPFAFNVPPATDFGTEPDGQLCDTIASESSPPIDIQQSVFLFPHATVRDVCSSWP